MSMVRYDLPEAEIQGIIERSQQGSKRAQSRLLEVFSNFLSKYIQLLYYGKYSVSKSPDIRAFIALYVRDPEVRIPLLKNKLDKDGYAKVNKVIRGIQMMVQRYGDEGDIEQTVQIAFLHTVSVYKRRESKSKPGEYVPFAGYLSQYFKYIMKKFVDEFLIDQNGLHTFALKDEEANVGWSAQDSDEAVRPTGFLPPPGPTLEESIGPDVIDELWVVGDSARYPFDELSIQERQLIRWRYSDGMKFSEIAEKITEHPNTLREHFNRIRRKIEARDS